MKLTKEVLPPVEREPREPQDGLHWFDEYFVPWFIIIMMVGLAIANKGL